MALRWVERLCWLSASGPNTGLTEITVQDLEFCWWSLDPYLKQEAQVHSEQHDHYLSSRGWQSPRATSGTSSIKEPQHAEEPILFNISIPVPLKQGLSTWAATGVTWGAWNLPVPRTHLRPAATTPLRVRPRCLDVSKLPWVMPVGSQSWARLPKVSPGLGVIGMNGSLPPAGPSTVVPLPGQPVPHLNLGIAVIGPFADVSASRPTCALWADTHSALCWGTAPRVCSTQTPWGILTDAMENGKWMHFSH